jgi:3-hydroxyisobutyrate dehydrogenase
MRVAVLGTGIMGGPMARNLAAAGHEVSVWNRTREKAEGLGATVAGSPAEAVEGVGAVLTILADGPTVDAVIPELDPEVLWIQSSTVGIADTERFAARHPRFLDAPVLGSRPAAEAAQLLVLAAGPDRPEELLGAVSNRVMWLGDEPGAGTKLKLTINLWILNLVENLGETLALAEGLGLDQRSFLDAIKDRPMDSPYAQMKGDKIIAGDYSPAFALRLAAKDMGLAVEMARRDGIDLGLGPVTLDRMKRAIELGHGDDDMCAAWFATRRDTDA